jgi:hypothetical protein
VPQTILSLLLTSVSAAWSLSLLLRPGQRISATRIDDGDSAGEGCYGDSKPGLSNLAAEIPESARPWRSRGRGTDRRLVFRYDARFILGGWLFTALNTIGALIQHELWDEAVKWSLDFANQGPGRVFDSVNVSASQ